MKNILVANAGSASVKFRVFAVDGVAQLPRAVATTLE
jgi:acetate kinase